MRNEDGIPLVSPFAELRAENERLRAAIADVLEHREAKWSSWGRIVHEAALRRLEQVFKREKEGGVRNSGAELIAAERRRQVEAEGWTPEHDAEHDECEMLLAALCYANHAGLNLGMVGMESGQVGGSVSGPPGQPHKWPWEDSWWKPSDDPVRTLVKAGALIAAEIDRLQRRPTP